jgi:hypothetical protein
MHIRLTNGQPKKYSIGQLRRDNPTTSFPKHIPEEMLAEWDVYPVEYKPQPNHNQRTQRVVPNAEPHQEEGQWLFGWSVVDKTLEEVQQYDDNAAQSVRSQRDRLLVATDWLVIKAQEVGVAMDQVWLDYRQALRDITDHVNFPHLGEADWPVKPE